MKKEIAVYVHIPFCIRKCRYCDFLSAPAGPEEILSYTEALKEEIRRSMPALSGYTLRSVFFGGGTPSILSAETIPELLGLILSGFREQKEVPEITIEANPGTLTEEKLCAWKEAGINRLSIGLQSADDRELKLLGRIHTYEDFLAGWEVSEKAGFTNRSVDLMSALPGQTLQGWDDTLTKIADLSPQHISAYSLIVEEGTPFFAEYGTPSSPGYGALPSEEEERQMYYDTEDILKTYGYARYEISNYALPGSESVHNTAYWTGVPYIGFGIGAASYLPADLYRTGKTEENGESITGTCTDTDRFPDKEKDRAAGKDTDAESDVRGMPPMVRCSNLADRLLYIKNIHDHLPVTEKPVVLTRENLMEETMFLGLRMMQGISFSAFSEKFGVSLESVYGPVIGKMVSQGLLTEEGARLKLTPYGIDVSNYVFAQFLL